MNGVRTIVAGKMFGTKDLATSETDASGIGEVDDAGRRMVGSRPHHAHRSNHRMDASQPGRVGP